MWISWRLGRHTRLGAPWPIALLLYPFIVLGYMIAGLIYLVALILTGIAWLAIWPFRRNHPPKRRARPRAATGTPGDDKVRLEIHIHED